jgi:hypothetical protein
MTQATYFNELWHSHGIPRRSVISVLLGHTWSTETAWSLDYKRDTYRLKNTCEYVHTARWLVRNLKLLPLLSLPSCPYPHNAMNFNFLMAGTTCYPLKGTYVQYRNTCSDQTIATRIWAMTSCRDSKRTQIMNVGVSLRTLAYLTCKIPRLKWNCAVSPKCFTLVNVPWTHHVLLTKLRVLTRGYDAV